MISTKVRSRQSSWRNGSGWLKLIEKECVCSDVVDFGDCFGLLLWFWRKDEAAKGKEAEW